MKTLKPNTNDTAQNKSRLQDINNNFTAINTALNSNVGSIKFYLDEAHNALKVYVTYSNGIIKTGSIALG